MADNERFQENRLNKETKSVERVKSAANRYKIKAKSKCGRFSQMMSKLASFDATVRLSHLSEDLVVESKDAVKQYNHAVAQRFGQLVRAFMLYHK